jgi:formamidopyrimidine-DNA glycosylase
MLLLDQHLIAGIGNIYSDEILHRARIHPDRAADTLTRPAVRRLHQQILDVLGAAVRRRGSTLGDGQYVDLMGGSGSYQLEHLVYGRAGERCRTCGRGIIRRGVAAGRSYHWCPVCQRP